MAIVISGTTGISANAVQFLIGQVIFMAGANAPSGFLKCNGQLVSRTTYASLFAVIGTTYGAGDGSTTFAVPDLRGEFIRCLDDGRGVDAGRGIGTAQIDEFKNHDHIISSTLGLYAGGATGQANYGADTNPGSYKSAKSGGGETRPRNVALLACIFTGV
jgi:microcystin-dependent protein